MPGLMAFLQEQGFGETLCHGCAFGRARPGRPIKKPWKIVSTHSPLVENLNKDRCSCPRGSHIPCSGSATSNTENYTPRMAQIMVGGVFMRGLEHCSALSAQSRSFSAVQALAPTGALDLSQSQPLINGGGTAPPRKEVDWILDFCIREFWISQGLPMLF